MTQDSLLEHAAPGLPNPTRKRVPLDDVCEAELTGAPNAGVSSMERDGQLEAVKLCDRGEGQLLLIADGNRRVANARKLGWTHIDALVYPALSSTQLAHLQLGLHLRAPNLVTEALALGRLMQSVGNTVDEDLARESKLSVTRVRKLRKLLALPRDVLELTGTVLSEGVAESVANLQGEHRSRAVALIRSRANEDRGRFTNADLKDVQLARDTGLAALLGGVSVATPVVTLSAADLLAAQVRVMCSEAQVSLKELFRVLARNEAPIPLHVPVGHVPVTCVPVAPWEDGQPAPRLDLTGMFGVAAGTATERPMQESEDKQPAPRLDLTGMFGVAADAEREKLMQGLFRAASRTGQPDPWDLPALPPDAETPPVSTEQPESAPASVAPPLDDVIQARGVEHGTAAVSPPVEPRGASFGVRSFGNVRGRPS